MPIDKNFSVRLDAKLDDEFYLLKGRINRFIERKARLDRLFVISQIMTVVAILFAMVTVFKALLA